MKYLLYILITLSSITAQNGIIKTYYPDGTPRSEISYVNDILDGSAYWYFPNGNIQQEKQFSNGILSGFVREFYNSGLLKIDYSVKNGIKNGSQKIFYENGSLKELSIFSDGIKTQEDYFEYDPNYEATPEEYLAGNKQQELLKSQHQGIICDVDVCPVPVGGLITIQENLIYPEHALLYGMEGTVSLNALIGTDGNVLKTEVTSHLGLGCDEAAQEAVKKTKFIPGQKDGKIVESNLTLNVNFKILDRSFVKNDQGIYPENKIKQIQNESRIKKLESIGSNKETIMKNSDQNLSNSSSKQTVAIICNDADVCPSPENGIGDIEKNMSIPFIAKRLKLTGIIEVEALIDQYGIAHETKVIKGIGYGCDDAVESAIMKTKFIPAKKSGIEIDTRIKIIFPFSYTQQN